MKRAELAKYMDHTLLKPEATEADIDRVVGEALRYGTASVCVNPYWVGHVSEGLAGTDVNTCAVVGFPLGATSTRSKADEAGLALSDGAREIDMVINVGELKAGAREAVRNDIAAVAEVVHDSDALLKVIIETCLLTDGEKRLACELAVDAGADFVKTSTGFSTGGATTADVRLMRETVGPEVGVKASGGIRTYADALAMIEAGANRLGVSAAVAILEEAPE